MPFTSLLNFITIRSEIYSIKVLTFTLKIACRVRRWRSVKTKRGFFGEGISEPNSSLRLQPETNKGAFFITCFEIQTKEEISKKIVRTYAGLSFS